MLPVGKQEGAELGRTSWAGSQLLPEHLTSTAAQDGVCGQCSRHPTGTLGLAQNAPSAGYVAEIPPEPQHLEGWDLYTPVSPV